MKKNSNFVAGKELGLLQGVTWDGKARKITAYQSKNSYYVQTPSFATIGVGCNKADVLSFGAALTAFGETLPETSVKVEPVNADVATLTAQLAALTALVTKLTSK